MMALASQGLNKTMNMHVVGPWWSTLSQRAFSPFSKWGAPIAIRLFFIFYFF